MQKKVAPRVRIFRFFDQGRKNKVKTIGEKKIKVQSQVKSSEERERRERRSKPLIEWEENETNKRRRRGKVLFSFFLLIDSTSLFLNLKKKKIYIFLLFKFSSYLDGLLVNSVSSKRIDQVSGFIQSTRRGSTM